MEFEEYLLKLKDIEAEFEKQKRALRIECALSNNPYKIGDVIKDHTCKIKIESWVATLPFGSGKPYLIYRGLELKVDGTPKKHGKKTDIHQTNIEK